MPLHKYRHYFRLLLTCVIFMICWLAFSKPTAQTVSLGYDKLNHLIAFTTLALLFDYSFPLRAKTLLVTLLGFGIFIELIQATIPGRSASGWDILADLIGITIYLTLQPLRAQANG
jgi:VanZ family protein